MPGRFRPEWMIAVLGVVLWGCGGSGERVAGGNVGTEAGNAVSARLVGLAGKPAAGARVVVRPVGAIDSTGRATWVRAVADSQGVARFRIDPDQAWSLEAAWGAEGIRMELPPASAGEFADTLQKLSRLEGVLLGVDSGAVVVLPGLARSVVVGSGGAFRFDSLPQGGRTEVRQLGGSSWVLDQPLPAAVVLASPTEQPRLAWWAASSGAAPLVGTGIVFDSLVRTGADPVEGPFHEAELGGSLARLEAAAMGNAGAFSLSMRLRLTSPAIGSIWLLDLTDPAFAPGLRMGVGGGKIRIQMQGLDTSMSVPTPQGWETWVVGFDGNRLVVWTGGQERLRLDAPPLVDRAPWTRRSLGAGGGMQASSILVWDRMVDGGTISARPPVRRF